MFGDDEVERGYFLFHARQFLDTDQARITRREGCAIPILDILEDARTQRWMKIMQTHELGLYRHSLHIGMLVTEFTRFHGFGFEDAWPLVEGALLHDVGKTQLPSALLIKPETLNSCEQQLMLLHPQFGAALLEADGNYDEQVVEIVRSHHERLDGSGYPESVGNTTPQIVRIVAVCDAFGAMTEKRPYEDAWPAIQALERLESMAEQYDAEVVLALRQLIQAKKQGYRSRGLKMSESINVLPTRAGRGLPTPRSAFFPPMYPPARRAG